MILLLQQIMNNVSFITADYAQWFFYYGRLCIMIFIMADYA